MLLPETQRLLKANAARELGTRVAFNFDDLQHQGENYLADVRTQAAQLIQAAEQEAAAIRAAAQQAAWDAGRKEGLANAAQLIETQATTQLEQRFRERIQTTLPAIASIATALEREFDQWRMHWETQAIQVAVGIAEKLIHQTLEVRVETAAGMIAEALKLAAGHQQLRIHLHPDDLRQLGDQAASVVRSLTSGADATLTADVDVGRGGCRIETRHGEIDARVETMLERIAEELLA